MAKNERLDKLTAAAFGLSRSEAAKAVKGGRVSLNGQTVTDPERKISPTEVIFLDGQRGIYEKYIYIMMDKPEGYLSATEDREGEPVTALLPDGLRRRKLGIVGRLDKDAAGLLLLTDNGELNHRLTSPRYHMDKVYRVRLDGRADEEDIRAFADGMELGDFKAMPARLEIMGEGEICLVTIKEGKFHQVKRMFEKRGLTVLSLRRLSIGGLRLDDALGAGGWRYLTAEEKKYLEEKSGIKQKN